MCRLRTLRSHGYEGGGGDGMRWIRGMLEIMWDVEMRWWWDDMIWFVRIRMRMRMWLETKMGAVAQKIWL